MYYKYYPNDDVNIKNQESIIYSKYRNYLQDKCKDMPEYVFPDSRLLWGKYPSILNSRPIISKDYVCSVLFEIVDSCGNVIESRDRDLYMDFSCTLSWYDDGKVIVKADLDEYDKEEIDGFIETCMDYFKDPF